jgi:cell division protease FtsH
MVTRYGMDEKLGMVSLESERAPFLQAPGEFATVGREYSEQTAREVDCAVHDFVTAAFDRALALLETHSAALEEGAQHLLAEETLSGDELPELSRE